MSGVRLRGLIETDGIAPDELIWPAGVAPIHAVRADAALGFPPLAPVRPEDFQPASPPPPEWLRELAVKDLTALPPPPAAAWIPDVRRAEQVSGSEKKSAV